MAFYLLLAVPRPSLLISPALLSKERMGTRVFLTPSLAVLQLIHAGVRKPGYIASDKTLLYTRLQLVMANLPPYLSCMQQGRRQSLCHRIPLLLLAIHCWGEKKYINSHLEPHTQTTCDLGSLGFIPSIVPISHFRSGNETRGGWF